MKTHIKIILISILSSSSFYASAQREPIDKNSNTHFYWKDVARFQNKGVINTPQLTLVSIGYPQELISKEVNKKRNSDKRVATGNIVSTGYPQWTISKPVARRKK